MEMGNVSKRQQPDQIKNNSRRSPTGLQCSEKFPHPEASSRILFYIKSENPYM